MLAIVALSLLALFSVIVAWLGAKRVRFNNEVRLALLALKHKAGAGEEVFTAARVAGLPEPVQRYFTHAIAEGTRLARSADFQMEGEIQLNARGKWLPFSAREVIAGPQGFIWNAGVKAGILPVKGVDQFLGDEGRMRVWVAGLLPIIDARSEDISRSTVGRLAAELPWAPSLLLAMEGVRWSAPSDEEIVAAFELSGEKVELHLKIGESGALKEMFLERWSINVDSGGARYLPFGGRVSAESHEGGYTYPNLIEGGWYYGTDRYAPFIKLTITGADFR